MHLHNQRQFSRIRFHHGARLLFEGNAAACEVVDLSLKGALLRLSGKLPVDTGASCVLELVLDDGIAVVRMEGRVAHREATRIGLKCRSIDLNSITHLRRLLELNLGDAALLEREFAALQRD